MTVKGRILKMGYEDKAWGHLLRELAKDADWWQIIKEFLGQGEAPPPDDAPVDFRIAWIRRRWGLVVEENLKDAKDA